MENLRGVKTLKKPKKKSKEKYILTKYQDLS